MHGSDIGQVARFEPDGTPVWRSDAQGPLTAMAVGRSVIALGCLSGGVRFYELSGSRLLGMGAMQSAIFKLDVSGAGPPIDSPVRRKTESCSRFLFPA